MRDDRLYLIHILECIERIESYTMEGREAFMKSSMAQDAVIRNFEIIGEAAKRISEGLTQAHPTVAWRLMAGFRDVLIHNYPGVDLEEVWTIVSRDLLPLKEQIATIRQSLG